MSQTEKSQIDTAALSVEDFASKAAAKVALDIDDAPFLIDDEPEAPVSIQEEAPAPAVPDEDEARAAALRRRKKLIIIGLGVFSLLLIAFAVWFFVLRDVPGQETAQPSATVVVVPSPESITGPPIFPVDFEDFWVPQKDAAGMVHFLRVHFSSEVTDEKITREIKAKLLVLRDAVYYYLRNKPHEFMLDPLNLPVIKQDLLDIINGYLSLGKLEDLYIENFLIK